MCIIFPMIYGLDTFCSFSFLFLRVCEQTAFGSVGISKSSRRTKRVTSFLYIGSFLICIYFILFISRASVFGCSLSKLPGATRPSCSLISLLELRVEIYPASPSFSSLFIGIGTEKKREENSPVGIYKQKEPWRIADTDPSGDVFQLYTQGHPAIM